MVQKITNPQEFLKILNDLDELFSAENQTIGHVLPIKKESLAQIANSQLLTWTYHVWANKSGEKYDSLLIFQGGEDILFGRKIFYERLWLSKGNAGLKMLKQAKTFAKENGYTHYMMGRTVKNQDKRTKKLYGRLSLTLDSECYIGLL